MVSDAEVLDDPFDPNHLAITPGILICVPPRSPLPRLRPGSKFVKGPIPLAWIQTASRLPGKALAVGMFLWFLVGLRKSNSVPLNLSRVGIPQSTASQGLRGLETAGLVTVVRRTGRPALVTLRTGGSGP